jgi:hypothetical protein
MVYHRHCQKEKQMIAEAAVLSLSLAQVPPDPEASVAEFAAAIYQAFSAKNWGVLVALALIGLVAIARKYGSKALPFLGTDRGGALLSLLGGFGLSVFAAATAAGAHSVLQVIGSGLLMTITASGTYAIAKKLLFPSGANKVQEIQADAPGVQAAAAGAAVAGDQSAADMLKGALK